MADNIASERPGKEVSRDTLLARATAPFLAPLIRDASASELIVLSADKGAAEEFAAQGAPAAVWRGLDELRQSVKEGALIVHHRGLQLLAETEIGGALASLRASGAGVIFIIPTMLDIAADPSGANAHRTVRPAEWWAERVAAYFSEALLVPWPDKAVCVITTWRPNAEALRACQNAIKAQATKRKFTRRWDRLSNRVRLFLNPPETRAGLLASLDGKRVAIVGNALSLAERTFGAEIESHDLVVRFNGACLPHRRSHGVRADWIATGISFDPAIAEAQNARTILWMSPNHKNLPPWMTMRRTGHFYLHARSDHQDLARRIGSSRPTTGAMMIDLALRNPNVKTVSLYGFDFFATPSFSGHHTAETAPHEFNREKAFIEALAARDPRLSLRALGSG